MNFQDAPNINHLWARLLIEELFRCGVDYFCLSPGSRSSPLSVAVALHRKVKSLIHYDERGLAFHALGYASAAKRPAALICTSGTAAANFYPAVIEASKKKVPLIVLTADRPPELRSTGADQTIDQVHLFGNYVRWFVDLPCPTTEIKPEFLLTTIDQAVYRARIPLAGPVHLNCMYREPLAPVATGENFSDYLKDLRDWENTVKPLTTYITPEPQLSSSKKHEVLAVLNSIKNGVVVVGKLSIPAEQEGVLKLAAALHWPVFPDITSGLRLGVGKRTEHVIPYFDQILLSEKLIETCAFDGVLHLGGRISSKRWYEFIQQARPRHYVMVNNHPLRNDPLHNVTLRVEASVSHFCESLAASEFSLKENPALTLLQNAAQIVHTTVENFLIQTNSLNEIIAARCVSRHIPSGHALFLASSMPIRDMDMHGVADANAVAIGANRGASGIDGTLAAAAGFAAGLNQPVTLMIGDLALLHDLNSLGLLNTISHPVIVIVLNNNGGGIFSFLPIAQFDNVFEKYFGTPHHLNFLSVSTMFELPYAHPRTPADFVQAYQSALAQKKSMLIEITSQRNSNFKLHQDLQVEIRKSLEELVSRRTKAGRMAQPA